MTPVRCCCDFVRASLHPAVALAAVCLVLCSPTFSVAGPKKRPAPPKGPPPRADFSGDWDYSLASYSFSLRLRREGKRLTGYHSIVAGSGFMVDSVLPEHGAPSIRGSVSGVRAVVDFRSGKDPQASGRGELVLKDGGLHWKRFEGRGDHLFPVSQVLQPAQGFLEKAREFRRRRFPHEKAPSSGAGSSATAKRGESAR